MAQKTGQMKYSMLGRGRPLEWRLFQRNLKGVPVLLVLWEEEGNLGMDYTEEAEWGWTEEDNKANSLFVLKLETRVESCLLSRRQTFAARQVTKFQCTCKPHVIQRRMGIVTYTDVFNGLRDNRLKFYQD